MTREHIALCLSSIGEATFAFASDQLTSFMETDAVPTTGVLDLANVFTLDRHGSAPAHAVLIRSRGSDRVVWLGSSIRLRTVALSDLYPLPALVGSLHRSAGVVGIVMVENSFALLIDFEYICNNIETV